MVRDARSRAPHHEGRELAFNVFNHGSRQLQVAAVPKVQVDAQAAAARLAEAIRFRTISSYEKPEQNADALRGMQAHIERSFPAFHATAKREVVADYSLLYTWEGADATAPPIALLAHQDVVPVAPGTDKDWQHPPYDGVIADGFIWVAAPGTTRQSLFHAGCRRDSGQSRLQAKAHDLFRLQP